MHIILNNAIRAIESLDALCKSDVFEKVIDAILNTSGKIVICGIGKSGHAGKKIAATISSVGKSAIFMHASEANHGDLGMLSSNDILLVISKSGESEELELVIDYCKNINIPVISIVAFERSSVALKSNFVLLLSNIKDEINLIPAPSASVLATIALGDCIANELSQRLEFTKEKYQKLHPAGKLGHNMRKIESIMHTKELPLVGSNSNMRDIIQEITEKKFGMSGVIDDNGVIIGIITDGDLRRALIKLDPLSLLASEIMTQNPKFLDKDILVINAIDFLHQNKITSAFVVNEKEQPIGCLNIHDLI